jgi:hypothetical protein
MKNKIEKIGIIGDTHGFFKSSKKAFDLLINDLKVDLILHVGDVLYCSTFNSMTEDYLPHELVKYINSIKTKIIFCRGDCDSDVDANALNYPITSREVLVDINGVSIMMHHGEKKFEKYPPYKKYKPYMSPKKFINYVDNMAIDICIMGRTHQPLLKKIKKVYLINPGSPVPTVHDNKEPAVGLIDFRRSVMQIVSTKEGGKVLKVIKM